MNADNPKTLCYLAMTSILFLFLSGVAKAQCGSNSPNCVDVGLQESGSPPGVNPPTNRFRLEVGGTKSQFSFGLSGDPGRNGTVYVVFKCQSYSEPHDCRTPAVHANGSPTWAVKLTPNGVTSAIDLGSLNVCVNECSGVSDASEYEDCVAKFCKYPYMVVDVRGGAPTPSPPMDPDFVVDPR